MAGLAMLPACAEPAAVAPDGGADLAENASKSAEATTELTVSFLLPTESRSPQELALVSSDEVELAPDVTVSAGEESRPAAIAALGTGGAVVLGPESEVGSVFSTGAVAVGSRGMVSGDVRAAGAIALSPGATVTGAMHSPVAVPTYTVTRTFSIPIAQRGTIRASSGITVAQPGQYNRIESLNGATVRFASGAYQIGTLDARPGSSLVFDTASGPVILVVDDVAKLAARVAETSERRAQILWYLRDTGTIKLESGALGTGERQGSCRLKVHVATA